MNIHLKIGSKIFEIPCLEGEEEATRDLAKTINRRLSHIKEKLHGESEENLLVIAMLMMQAEIDNLHEDRNQQSQVIEREVSKALSANMDNISDYLKKLTNKISHF